MIWVVGILSGVVLLLLWMCFGLQAWMSRLEDRLSWEQHYRRLLMKHLKLKISNAYTVPERIEHEDD